MLDIPIDYYVKMNFNAFIEVVDALGGIEAEVPYQLTELDENDKRTINLEPGLQELNGKEALALARTRKLDNDIERGKRQQMILKSIMKQATSVSSITKYGNLIDAVGDNMKTNMSFNEMKSFLAYAKGGMPEVETLNISGTDDKSTGIWYWLLNEEDLQQTILDLRNHLELPASSSLVNDNSEVSNPNINETADDGNLSR